MGVFHLISVLTPLSQEMTFFFKTVCAGFEVSLTAFCFHIWLIYTILHGCSSSDFSFVKNPLAKFHKNRSINSKKWGHQLYISYTNNNNIIFHIHVKSNALHSSGTQAHRHSTVSLATVRSTLSYCKPPYEKNTAQCGFGRCEGNCSTSVCLGSGATENTSFDMYTNSL